MKTISYIITVCILFLGLFSYKLGFNQAVTTPCTGLDCSANGITALEYPTVGATKINWSGTCPVSGYQSINQTAKVTPGSAQTFRITVTDPSRLGVWIDWNDDGNFQATENIYLSTTPHLSTGLNNVIITVSTATALPGPHAMRVLVTNSGFAMNTSSALTSNCSALVGGAVFGHIQDYKVTVDGVDMKLDQILGLPLTGIFSAPGTFPMQFKLDNVGVYPIDTCNVTWMLTPGSKNKPSNPGVYTAMMCPTCASGGTMINPGGTYNFFHPQPLKIDSLGRDTLCVWVKSIHNGNTIAFQDKFTSNDTLCNKNLVLPKRDVKPEALLEPVQCPTSLFANNEYPVKMVIKNQSDLALTSANQDSIYFGYFVKFGSVLVDQADTVIAVNSIPSGSTYTYTFKAPGVTGSSLILPTNGVYDIWLWAKLNKGSGFVEHVKSNDTLGPFCLRADLKNCKSDSITVKGIKPYTVGNNYQVRLHVKNVGTKDAINPVVGYRVNNGTPVTSVFPTVLTPGEVDSIVITTPFTPTTTGVYNIKAWIKMFDDLDATNDTAYKTIVVGSPIIDIRPESIVSPVYIKSGQPTTLSVWVENLGSSVMTDYTIEVREQFASTAIATDVVNGTLVFPGGKILHNFTGTFTPTKDTMVLCFKTINPNNQADGNTVNDVLCRTLTPQPVSPSSINNATIPDIANVEIFPNPNNGEFTLQLNSAKTQEISIEIYNLQGQKVHGITNTYLSGAYVLPMNLTNLPQGVYYCRVASGNQLLTKKVVIY
jgi:hypothetical protein